MRRGGKGRENQGHDFHKGPLAGNLLTVPGNCEEGVWGLS